MAKSPAIVPILVLPKPKLGSPCNGCGYCCIEQPCELSVQIIGLETGPCKALEEDGDKRVCGLLRRPAFYMFNQADVPESETAWLSNLYAKALGVGLGCDSDDPEERTIV